MLAGRVLIKRGLATFKVAEIAEFRAHKSIYAQRIALLHITCAVDVVVHRNHHAAVAGRFISCERNGIENVDRTVSRNSRGRAHGADNHYWLIALNHEVKEVSRLFQRIRAVRDHDAVNVLAGKQFIDAVGKFEPDFNRHRLRADARDLLTRAVGNLLNFRHGIEQRLHAESACLIARHLRVARGRTGDRAAGSEDINVRFFRLHILRGCCHSRHIHRCQGKDTCCHKRCNQGVLEFHGNAPKDGL